VDLGDEMTPSHQAGQRAEVERERGGHQDGEQQSVRPVRAALHRVEADEAYNTARARVTATDLRTPGVGQAVEPSAQPFTG